MTQSIILFLLFSLVHADVNVEDNGSFFLKKVESPNWKEIGVDPETVLDPISEKDWQTIRHLTKFHTMDSGGTGSGGGGTGDASGGGGSGGTAPAAPAPEDVSSSSSSSGVE